MTEAESFLHQRLKKAVLDRDRLLDAERLEQGYTGSVGGGAVPDSYHDHPLFTAHAWREDVAQGATSLGYWPWVQRSLKKAK